MEKQEIGIYGREKMFMRKKENELQIDWKHFYLGVLALVIPMALQNLINVGKRTCGQSRRFWVLECGLRFL